MRAIISSDFLYFFQDSPPRPSHLHTKIALEELMESRLACSKSSKSSVCALRLVVEPYFVIPLSTDKDTPLCHFITPIT